MSDSFRHSAIYCTFLPARTYFTGISIFSLQASSEVGVMGQAVEKFFDEVVERFLPYIDQRSATPTSIASDGKPKPKKAKRKSDEPISHIQ